MRIFLIGFMGCGKTTLGRKLAKKLSCPFVDQDTLFEEYTGISIPDYFKEFGEEKFRETEKLVLQTSSFPADIVVATGGGAPCYFDNMEWMNRNGLTVYLNMSPAALASRLENAGEERPVLQNHKGEHLVRFITAKLAERQPFYEKARICAEGLGLTAEKLASLILSHQRK